MCAGSSTTDTSGTLYDTGGPNNVYQVNEDCTLLVAPSCATSITLQFQSFSTESGFDFFSVYDGQTTAAPQLMNTSGPGLLPPPVTCTSGYMLIVWHSDVSITDSGFACTWTSVIAPSTAPTAAFTMATTTPPLNVGIQFTDQTVGGPTAWLWNFGNGDTARSQNPVYAYSTPGTYTVTLVAFTCNESDTITHQVIVQGPPQIQVSPLTGFNANVQCGDSATFNLDVSNIAGGQLVYTLAGSLNGSIKVLALTQGVDQFVEYPRTIAAINHYFTNYTLTSSGTTDPGVLSGLLIGQNVLLIPEHETGNDSIWYNMGPVIRQFLNNGGSVIFLGSFSSYSNDLFWSGVFSGSYVENEEGLSVDIIGTHPLLNGITNNSFIAPSATYSMNFTDPNIVRLVEYQGNDVVSYKYYGAGKAIFLAFDYYNSTPESEQILANAIQWGGINALPLWIHLNPTSDTVDAAQTSHVSVTMVAGGFPAGTYYATIGVSSNDPNNPLIQVPCTLSVSGLPIINLSDSCLAIGQVMQHTTARDTFRIVNAGCDTLFLSSITCSNPVFTLNANVSYLLPGAFADIPVTFNSPTLGTQNGTITILNNDNDTSICISATVFPAPVVSISANSVTENLRACSDSGTASFTITNTGGSDLIISNVSGIPAWMTSSLSTDTIPQGATVTVSLGFASGTMTGGQYVTNLQIHSNDPLALIKTVPCTLIVDINPCVDFSFTTNTCTGFANFTATSINTPTSWSWNFGDQSTGNVQNPAHPYTSNGNYPVTLIACNGAGCDTVTQSVQAIITGPKATTCYPATLAYCCNIGVTQFRVTGPWNDLYNNISSDAVAGYEDFTCTDTATLVTNYPYVLHITTGPIYPETVKIWIDLNNDGILDPSSEQMYVDSNVLMNHTGTLNIPSLSTNVYGQPLRMRVSDDYTGNPTPTPCLDLQFGQHEDYSLFLQFYDGANELIKDAGFSVYPNPFNTSASITYTLKGSSAVVLEAYNIMGEKVSSLVSEHQYAGKYTYQFTNQPSGVYFIKLTIDGKTGVQKIIKM
jgi:PKD repeat protein